MSDSSQGARGPVLRDEQRAAVMVRGVSVALSASAGCGKTTVLTERYLAELDHGPGRPLERVVALTFTEKAARELKGRIRARLLGRFEADERSDHAEVLLRGLDAAPIGTFHQYCARLVRRFALELGVDPEFAVLDEVVAASIREEAAEHTLRELLDERNDDLIQLALGHGLGMVRDALVELISSNSAAELEAWGGLARDQVLDHWRGARERVLRPRVFEELQIELAAVREAMESLRSSDARINGLKESVLAALDEARGDDPSAIDRIKSLRERLKVQGLGKALWPSAGEYENVKLVFEEMRESIDKRLALWADDQAERDLEAAGESLMFTRLAIRARGAYDRFKERRRGLDFADLITRALGLLRDGMAGSGRLLDVVLVDEFQDTDHAQSEILKYLGGERFLLGRVFVVGDVKQSIYRFRGALPAVFRDWRGLFPEQGRLALTETYRSAPGVAAFVNELFRGIFSELDPATAGDLDAYNLRPIRRIDSCDPVVEFVWARTDDEETGASASERREAEAAVLARRLRERLDAGWMVADRETRLPRPARPGDVALLFRAMTDVKHYEVALASEGLDYYTVGGSAFYAQQEIRDVVNLIALLEDPFDELSLAGSLRGPFFGLSDDALYRLATHGNRGLLDGFARFAETPLLPPEDLRRAERAWGLLERWRSLKDRLPMARLLETILSESGYEGALACEFLGDRKIANAHKLVRMARSFDRQGGFTLGALAARLRSMLDTGAREEQAASTLEDDSSVRLMSIHQAKGLEFPIVILPDLARDANPFRDAVVFDRELGVVVRLAGEPGDWPGLGHKLHRELEEAEDKAELLRLFYVATTRARDAIVLSASLNRKRASTSPVWAHLNSRFDILTGRAWGADGGAEVVAAVHEAAPPSDRAVSVETVSSAPLEEIERAILLAGDSPGRARPARSRRPRYVDLDDAGELARAEGRIDRLIRAIVASDGWSRGESLESIAHRAAGSIVPSASPRHVEGAIRRMQPWLESTLLAALKAASAGSIQAGLEMAASFPVSGGDVVALSGTCDLVFRGRDGACRGLIVAPAAASPSRVLLLEQLLARSTVAWANGSKNEAWLFMHGVGGRVSMVESAVGDPDSFAGAIEALVSAPG